MSKPKIGIFLPGQNGDIITAMSVLKYTDKLWYDKDIVWYCKGPATDLFKFNDKIAEVRHWAEGWKLPERCVTETPIALSKGEPPWEDWSILVDPHNQIHQSRKHMFELTKDLEGGYFPAPWMMTLQQRDGIDYPNISRKVFGADPSWPWHPYLCFSNEEREMVKEFCSKLPPRKTIMMETILNSSAHRWNDTMTRETMRLCRERFGKCNFIFACSGDFSRFIDDEGVVSCSHFTIRQTALVNDYCDLFVGVGSSISCATSCWGSKSVPKIQFTGSFVGSTRSLANGPFDLIAYDYQPDAEQTFYNKLREVLNKL